MYIYQDQKTNKNTGGCFEKETLVTTKSSYNEETTILWIKYTETKSSTKANCVSTGWLGIQKYLLVHSLGYSNVKQ